MCSNSTASVSFFVIGSKIREKVLNSECFKAFELLNKNSQQNRIPYFFGYKTELFSFQNNPKDLDPSYKTDLYLWDCLGRVELVL